ncbi:sugar phosphate nucleotidyltransferase [Sulfurovum sp. XTW-4]|uniref:Sugar phosphate nucleotidyltransferase n=1 Tax=Sulfurovum xiamenensis TaxID=3019066 RepID=A0ABT7QRN1_9BACT|nr:sugar phosphate nucleotidyltransferase [Sulfurovum xiamenensis]MDM5263209.1 sugar phosphate nucleotidyltransferase [Sulfurovum xiamenensis]
MKAVVMAGGFGTRIQPLTNSRPKPMLPIMNKPMMEHTMITLKELGITEFIVLLYFKPEIIQAHFGDGSDFGIKITYVVPDEDYGTAGAVKLAQEYIGDDNFIIISGDLVTDFDFQKIFDYHAEKKSKLTITLTSVDNPLEFGVVIANEEGKIEKFLEKPSWGEVFSDTINTGIYIIEPEILAYIPKNENYDFSKDLFPKLMRKGIDLMAGYSEGYWRDVGNPESYRDVYDDILTGRVKFNIDGEITQFPDGVLYSDETYSFDQSIEFIGTVVLGKNVTLEKGVKLNNVVIGDNVTIGKESKIRNTVIWNDVEIHAKVKLDGCVICNDNVIGNNVTANAGMILAEGCEIGQLSKIEQDVTIWPDKKIEDASIVNHSLILGNKYKNSIFVNGTVFGKSNVELSCEMATKLAEAFGGQLPVGSCVVVSRDYHKSSRMLKRAFLGGLLSAGINVIDYRDIPSAVLRCNLSSHDQFIAGVHFRQKTDDPTSTVMTFFDCEALRINNEMSKKIEKAFFKETFRRVDYSLIGEIRESSHEKEYRVYKEGMMQLVNPHIFKCLDCRVAVDMMHGMASDVFPDIINDLGVENIMFNAHRDEHRLANINALIKQSKQDMHDVINALKLNAGFILYPYGQRLDIVSDKGVVLGKQDALNVVLLLLNMEAKETGTIKRVFLPTWAVDIVHFENLKIERGQYANFKAEKMREYDLVATGEGNFAFTEFATHRDSMFATLRILEMILHHGVKLSDMIDSLPSFYYKITKIECRQALKGKMMRMFLADTKGKESSTLDGVKIWLDKNDWILMIPDQYRDHLNLYIQSENEEKGEAILAEYSAKIEQWSKE